jgi:TRAP-type C4-dicarboxylate transport system substrate-binding protein
MKSSGFVPLAHLAVLAALFLAAPPRAAADETVVIRLGTILPSGTGPHAVLQELGERWRQESGGKVKLVLYPDGRLGGESEMVKKLRIKQLNAGVFSVTGLKEIDVGVSGLQLMPLMFHSWAEVDYVREHIRPQLEQRLRAKGFEVLFWADAGWVRFFSKDAATRPDEFRRMKMFTWVGDDTQIAIMRAVGYQPVPLETLDILQGMSTNMITTAPMPPLAALASRIYEPAPHMLDMNWVPMVGAAIVRTDVWEKIPSALRARLQAAADDAGAKFRARGRHDDDESVQAMRAHGLQIHVRSPEAEREWQELADQLYPKIRGDVVPADIFDAVLQHVREFRASHAAQP